MPTFVADEIVTAAKLNAATARDWDDWTPSMGGVTVGNGTINGRYVQIGSMVVVEFKFTLGSTSAITGEVTVSTPVTASRFETATWGARLNDTGTAIHNGLAALSATTTFLVRRQAVSGSNIVALSLSSTQPFTWTTSDFFSFSAIYEVP